MKVDAPFPQPPVAAPPPRPVPNPTEQASARPVDRPHHDEAAENRQPPKDELPPLSREQDATPPRDADDAHAASARHDEPPSQAQQTAPHNTTEPSRVGELLDVLA